MSINTMRIPVLIQAWLYDAYLLWGARQGSRVIALRCPACGHWVKPRHFRTPANQCRTCHQGPATRQWHRTDTPRLADRGDRS